MKVDVFICYETTTGRSYASNLKEALGKANMSAFMADEDIPKGTQGRSIIDEAIKNCTYFVVIMTILAIRSSEEVRREIELANKLNKKIIPCKPRTVDRFTTSILPIVGDLQQIDFDVKEDLADRIITSITKQEQVILVGQTSAEKAAETELSNIQAAVVAMMVDNNLSSLPNPVGIAINDMGAFPDTSACGIDKISDPNGNAYVAGDKDGYILYQHDITADGIQTELVNYVATQISHGTYTCDASGTITQVTTGYE